jgi:hypothetical protein
VQETFVDAERRTSAGLAQKVALGHWSHHSHHTTQTRLLDDPPLASMDGGSDGGSGCL